MQFGVMPLKWLTEVKLVTEAEWQTEDAKSMLTYLCQKMSRRKQVLLACGNFYINYDYKIKNPSLDVKRYEEITGRKIRGYPCYSWELEVREIAERYVDANATLEEVATVRTKVEGELADDPYPDDILHNTLTETGEQALNLLDLAIGKIDSLLDVPRSKWGDMISFAPFPKYNTEREADLVRDVFGNPFQPVPVIVPDWLSWNVGAVRKAATEIYEQRAFDRLPILAATLVDAGCHDEQILAHCRTSKPHIRGCWVIDQLLGLDTAERPGAIPR